MPRKTGSSEQDDSDGPDASMRPRPDAAENVRLATAHGRGPTASMRPRPDAAENIGSYPEVSILDALQ